LTEPKPITLAGLPGAFAPAEGSRRESPLLFLHCIMGHHRQFDGYLRFFSGRGFDSYAFSRRGRHGIPPEDARGLRIRDYLEDTVEVINALDRQPVVIGHSLGALLAQKAAEAGRCRAIVLIAPTAPRGVAVRPPASALPFYASAAPSILTGRSKIPPYEVVARVGLRCLPEDQRRKVYAEFVPESGLVLRELALGTPVDASKVRCPVLVVSGGEDGVCSPRVARAVARHYRADLREYPDSDHWMIEDPEWPIIAGDIVQWIEQLN
jgi:pimeloyl-ACP methyl ester carboxylesterase